MKYASVCDGIGAAHAAWQPLGWQCMWTSEIDPFPSAVVEKRWGFTNRGDMTKYKEWPDDDDGTSIDLLVGGTPCQSFSVAGLRKGLSDPRGGLMLTYLEIARRYRPRWVVWENVPGVLSSNGGRDFGSFLGALGDLGFGWAYRVIDAQWFGVAQRRRRVFVVGCAGDATSAAKVLFESESVQRNPAPSRTPRETIAACLGASPASSRSPNVGNGQGNVVAVPPVANPLTARMGKGLNTTCDEGQTAIISFHPTQDPISNEDGIVHALGTELPAIAIRTAQTSANGHGIAEDVCHTIDRAQGQAVAFAQNTRDEVRLVGGDGSIVGALAAQPGMKQTSYIAFKESQSGCRVGDVHATLDANNGSRRMQGVMPAVAHTLKGRGFNGSEDGTGRGTPLVPVAFTTEQTPKFSSDRALTITKQSPSGGGQPQCVMASMAVRRLTPRECERLQGFPDDYTAITYRKKPAADGPRYKSLGNSMAVPCMRWIGERIEAAGQRGSGG